MNICTFINRSSGLDGTRNTATAQSPVRCRQFFMRHLAILIILLGLYFNSNSQDRVNKKLPIISTQVLGQLQNATGWLYNPEGQWISRKNRIPANLPYGSRMLLDYEKFGIGLDNFISFELRKISIEDSTYYILIKTNNGGYYRYEAIQQDWIKTKEIYYYIFNTESLEQLRSLKDDTLQLVQIPIVHSGLIPLLHSLDNYLTDIKKQIVRDWGMYKEHHKYLCINLQLIPKKDLCRFLIFDYENDYGSSLIWGLAGDDQDKLVQYSPDNLKKLYFETGLMSFKNLFKSLTVR